ncbi:MAG: SusC/RagA family TonB-linked outer membrane protein [Prevotella shahii]|jgi:tonB-linked outer membrane protein, susC/ragA family|uniref:SusC/RagA family TonB-linked outer membrane protein n=1 Tax=Hoylesella shahii TaxID=228603 RepID=UPI001CB48967|nr:SusC/RagA family TonB-linked outer membrane protein [Hoylesella shahii]MBF1568248.1 SusC/RagA family TonB-linked outer membrane protein [Hoylesella shahii]
MQKIKFLQRISCVLFLNLLCFGPLSLPISAQELSGAKVTLSMRDASVEDFANEVAKQTGLSIKFTDKDVKAFKGITLDVRDQSVSSLLLNLSNQFPLSYNIEGNTITFAKKDVTQRKGSIRGQVTDVNGDPLVGAIIRVDGINGGFVTDINGEYEVKTDKKEVHLTVAYIGYKSVNKNVKNGATANITLHEDSKEMQEVVVTGYQTKNKNSFTGAQVAVTRDQLMNVGTKNVLKSIASFVPGMVISDDNLKGADPNSVAEINIRGRATFDGQANTPVFVVDGAQVTAEYVYDMDMNDIETVTVLKDASASALYGAKASAGVIVITTKTLKGGKLKLNYSGTVRLSTPDLHDYNLLNASEKLEYERLAGLFTDTSPSRQYTLDQDYARIFNNIQSGVETDWLSKPLRNAFSQSHSLSVDGGDERAKYNLGVRYGKDAGVMKGSDRSRLSTNFRLSYNVSGKFFVSNSSTISSVTNNESPYGDFSDWAKMNPYENPYDSDGKLRVSLYHDLANPLYDASLGSYTNTNAFDFLNTTSIQLWFGEKVRLDGDFTINRNKQNRRSFTSPLAYSEIRSKSADQRGSLSDNTVNTTTLQGKLMLSYNNYFFKKLFLTAMGGSSVESTSSDAATYRSIGYYSDKLGHPAFATSYDSSRPSGSDTQTRGVGVFVNANTIWDNKYFLDLIYRYEGSSRFGKNQRFAPFWSVGGGWNIHNEKFMKGTPVQLLKLRASVGYLGNINFNPYQALTTYSYNSSYFYGKGTGATPITIGNPDLKWERTLSTNIGLDFTAFRGRVDLSADYYIKNTDNLLLDITKAPSVGVTTSRENIGEVQNKGFELRLRTIPIQNKDWQWSLGLTYALNKNKIKKISNSLREQNEKNQSDNGVAPLPIYEEGQSLTALKVVPSAGIDPSTGQEIFIKRNGAYTFVYDTNDKVIFGDTNPSGTGSVFSYLTYKRFALSCTFQYSFGGALYNETLATKVEGANPKYNADERVLNDRWKTPGTVAKYKRIDDTATPYQTSRFVQRNNYLRMSSLSLSYEVPTNFIQKYGLKRMFLELLTNDLFYLSTAKRERGLNYPYDRSFEFSLRFSL